MILGNLGSPDAQGPLDPFPPETRTLIFFVFVFNSQSSQPLAMGSHLAKSGPIIRGHAHKKGKVLSS